MGIKSLIAAAAFAVGALTAAVPASAAMMNGGIGMAGAVTTDGTDLSNNTTLNFTFAFLAGSYGDLAGTDGTTVNLQQLVFDPFSGPINDFFTVVLNAGTLHFDLESVSVGSPRTATHLDLSGMGTLRLAGFDDTPGKWNLSATTTSGIIFTFDSNVATAVPEPATLALLGAGLAGLGFARRRKAAK